jgi:hypothetical protein
VDERVSATICERTTHLAHPEKTDRLHPHAQSDSGSLVEFPEEHRAEAFLG